MNITYETREKIMTEDQQKKKSCPSSKQKEQKH